MSPNARLCVRFYGALASVVMLCFGESEDALPLLDGLVLDELACITISTQCLCSG